MFFEPRKGIVSCITVARKLILINEIGQFSWVLDPWFQNLEKLFVERNHVKGHLSRI